MQGTWVQSLVGELRSHMPQGMVEKKKNEMLNLIDFWKVT